MRSKKEIQMKIMELEAEAADHNENEIVRAIFDPQQQRLRRTNQPQRLVAKLNALNWALGSAVPTDIDANQRKDYLE